MDRGAETGTRRTWSPPLIRFLLHAFLKTHCVVLHGRRAQSGLELTL